MTAFSVNLAYDNSTDTTFQTWVVGIHNSILSCSLVTASAAGQLDFSTVHTPSLANTYPVYRTYQFTDALQSTVSASVSYSIYLRVQYGSGNTAAMPQITVQVGNGIDASGSLTGVNSSTKKTIGGQNGALGSTTIYTSFFSGNGNRIACALWQTHPSLNGSGFFAVERSHDATGADTSNGIHVHEMAVPSNGNCFSQYLPIDPPQSPPTIETNLIALFSSNNSTQWNEGFAFSPSVPWFGQFGNPSRNVAAYDFGDFPADGGIFHVTHYGKQQTWLATGLPYGGDSRRAIAMRYE